MRIRAWRCKDRTTYRRRIEPLLPAFFPTGEAHRLRPALRHALHYTSGREAGEVSIRLYQSADDLRIAFYGSGVAQHAEAIRDYLAGIAEHEELGRLHWRECAIRMRMEHSAQRICEMLAVAEYIVLAVDALKVELFFHTDRLACERRSLRDMLPYFFLERSGVVF